MFYLNSELRNEEALHSEGQGFVALRPEYPKQIKRDCDLCKSAGSGRLT